MFRLLFSLRFQCSLSLVLAMKSSYLFYLYKYVYLKPYGITNCVIYGIYGKQMSRHMGKTKAQISFVITAKLISAFVFATRIVQFLLYLTPKFQASGLLLKLYRPVCVRFVRKPHCCFFHEAAQIILYL